MFEEVIRAFMLIVLIPILMFSVYMFVFSAIEMYKREREEKADQKLEKEFVTLLNKSMPKLKRSRYN